MQIVKNCKIAMYADDTVLYLSHPDFEVASRELQEDLDSLNKWCLENNILANTDKTKLMVFGSPSILKKIPPLEIKLGSTPVKEVTSYKYLGVTLDTHLNFNLQASKIVNIFSSKLKQFQRMRGFLSTRAASMVYKGTLLPILESGDVFMTAASVENRKWLQTLQNKGLRCALKKGVETSTFELHREANLLKLKFRREQHLLNYMYDVAKNPQNPKSRLAIGVKTRSASTLILKSRHPCTEKYKKSMNYLGMKKLNQLPEVFQSAGSKLAYKGMIWRWIADKAINVFFVFCFFCHFYTGVQIRFIICTPFDFLLYSSVNIAGNNNIFYNTQYTYINEMR